MNSEYITTQTREQLRLGITRSLDNLDLEQLQQVMLSVNAIRYGVEMTSTELLETRKQRLELENKCITLENHCADVQVKYYQLLKEINKKND